MSNFLLEFGLSYFCVLSMSPVGLFCECCRMSLLQFRQRLEYEISNQGVMGSSPSIRKEFCEPCYFNFNLKKAIAIICAHEKPYTYFLG